MNSDGDITSKLYITLLYDHHFGLCLTPPGTTPQGFHAYRTNKRRPAGVPPVPAAHTTQHSAPHLAVSEISMLPQQHSFRGKEYKLVKGVGVEMVGHVSAAHLPVTGETAVLRELGPFGMLHELLEGEGFKAA